MLSGLLYFPRPLPGYAVLTHEAIIDSEWDDLIKPFLLRRFPGASPAQLRQARAYAVTPALRDNLLAFYAAGSGEGALRNSRRRRRQQLELAALKAARISPKSNAL